MYYVWLARSFARWSMVPYIQQHESTQLLNRIIRQSIFGSYYSVPIRFVVESKASKRAAHTKTFRHNFNNTHTYTLKHTSIVQVYTYTGNIKNFLKPVIIFSPSTLQFYSCNRENALYIYITIDIVFVIQNCSLNCRFRN